MVEEEDEADVYAMYNQEDEEEQAQEQGQQGPGEQASGASTAGAGSSSRGASVCREKRNVCTYSCMHAYMV